MLFLLFFKPEDTEASSRDYPSLTYLALAMHLVMILASCLLVYGASNNKKWCLVPWMFFTFLFVVPILVITTVTNTARPSLKGIFSTVMDVFYGLYFFLVVWSHFFILKEAQQSAELSDMHAV